MMKKFTLIGLLSLLFVLLAVAPASAHTAVLIAGDNIVDATSGDLDNYFLSAGTTQSFIYALCEGPEYDFVGSANPLNITVVAPDGTETIVLTEPETEEIDVVSDGTKKEVTYQKMSYNFTENGTYFVYTVNAGSRSTGCVKTAIFVGENVGNNWSKNLALPLEFTTYTSPLNIVEGETLFGKVNYGNGGTASNSTISAEIINNAATAKALENENSTFPVGENRYVKSVLADESGNFGMTMTEHGIWIINTSAEIDGSRYSATAIIPVLPQSDAANKSVNETPGFGVLLALLAIVGAVLIIRRK